MEKSAIESRPEINRQDHDQCHPEPDADCIGTGTDKKNLLSTLSACFEQKFALSSLPLQMAKMTFTPK